MSLTEDAEQHDELARVKRELDRVQRQLFEVKHKRADYLETVHAAVVDTIQGQTIKPVKPPKIRGVGTGGGLHMAALLSDMQTGKITPDYNSEVAGERVRLYAEKIIDIGIRRGITDITVGMLGDMVEGVDIFPGQQWLIDSTLYRQIFDTTPVYVVEFLRKLLTWFSTVTVEAVQGNHGRLGRKGQHGPEDNADKMVYRICELMMRDEPRVEWRIADPVGEAAWYQIAEIGNYKAMLIHGDQIRGANGFPWYGLGKKVHGWASGGLPGNQSFDDLWMGHYHTLTMVGLNHRKVWANGSTESYNTFAAETLAAQSRPSQWVLVIDKDAGHVESSYPVYLA